MLIESFVKETQSSPCGALVRHTVTLTGPAFRTRLATAPHRSSPLPGPGYLTARPSSAPGPGSTKRQGRQHSGSPDDGNCPGPVDYPPGFAAVQVPAVDGPNHLAGLAPPGYPHPLGAEHIAPRPLGSLRHRYLPPGIPQQFFAALLHGPPLSVHLTRLERPFPDGLKGHRHLKDGTVYRQVRPPNGYN